MPEPGGRQAPSGDRDAALAWLGCPVPNLPRQGPLGFPDILSLSYLGTGRAPVRFLWLPSHPNSGGSGLDALLISTLGWGDLPACEISLISSPLSSSGEDDSFLFRGTLRTSKGCLPSKALLSRAIFCLDSLRKFAITLCGFYLFFFLFSLLPLVCDFSKQPIFLTEALTISCFLSCSSLSARCEQLTQTPLS